MDYFVQSQVQVPKPQDTVSRTLQYVEKFE